MSLINSKLELYKTHDSTLNIMQKSFTLFLVLFVCSTLQQSVNASIKIDLKRVEPMNWWIGMENPNLQLLVYGTNISATDVTLNYPGVEIKHVIKVANPNYLFIDLVISKQTKPGKAIFHFSSNNKDVSTYSYEFFNRTPNSKYRQGFNSSDAIYLIMPDRFANGDTKNDDMPGMLEKADRNAPYGRHGGDLKGINTNIDYIKELGVTALWLNPVQENNQPESSYHGYAITDFYKIDARLGTNEDFKSLTETCSKQGIKMIMDMVFNHCGHHHWWMSDLPSNDWLNQFPEFTRSNYRLSTVAVSYASKADLNITTRGWFDNSMPDMNLQNPLMANYLIQNSIWWIEYAGLSGIRMDTYPYPDKMAMVEWNKRVMTEYPNFNIVGEAWISTPAKLCYWQKDFLNKDGFNSELKSLMDFPMMEALKSALNEGEGWDSGLQKLYDVLADDYLYPSPQNMVVFPENHDIGRFMYFVNGDINKYKMAMAFVSTVRGIPQFYYGTEILMTGNGFDGHSHIREDFPGGWQGDTRNAFTNKGRTSVENEAHDYLMKLLNYRKSSNELANGKLLHFLPQNNVYVYFRYTNNKAVMVILNNSETDAKKLDTNRFNEIMANYTRGTNILTGEKLTNLSTIEITPKSATLIELSN